jgi:CrcB protein
MSAWPWVALGGALGALARYAAGMAFAAGAARFPWPTFAINVVGCLALGLVAGTWARHPALPPTAATFLATGVLGGFTTFSAFGLETLALLRRGDATLALAYAVASVVAGVLAAWIGLRAAGG